MKNWSFRAHVALASFLVSAIIATALVAIAAYVVSVQYAQRSSLTPIIAQLNETPETIGDGGPWQTIELVRAMSTGLGTASSFTVWRHRDFGLHRDGDFPGNVMADFGGPEGGQFPQFREQAVNERHWKTTLLNQRDFSMGVAIDLTRARNTYYFYLKILALVLAVALCVAASGSWLALGRAARPIDTLTAAVESITAQGLEQRLPEQAGGDTIRRLVDGFNAMLERLERSFNHATRFSADAAHELKTPLAILQGQLDQAIQDAPDGSPLQQNLGRLLEEVQRLKVIVRRLLLLSLADAGRIRVSLAPIRLDELLEETMEDMEILAPELRVINEVEGGITVQADKALIQQAIQNLVNNAIKYNVPDGKVRFQLFRHQGAIRFAIANTSEGIPEAERRQVFRRFFRADPAHSRNVDGVGLGLSLSREIVRAHNGKLWLADAPEGWVMFVLELPEADDTNTTTPDQDTN